MLPTKRDQHKFPTTSVRGDFPVTYHYTAGISGEKFFLALKERKLLANTCSSCNMTYLPPKMFCEDCFDELGDDTYKEITSTGEVFSFTEVFYDHRGDRLVNPYFLGLIVVDGSDTKFLHKLLVSNPEIGMKVKAVWNDNRVGSIMDLMGFES